MRPVVLSIAGLDPGGGAGIVADVKAIEAHGCWAAAVATALTVQTVARVSEVLPVAPQLLGDQIDAVFADHPVAAVKLGLLGPESTVRSVADALRCARIPIVFDPVCASTSGTRFLDDRALACVREHLLPIVSVVTPNLNEAELLAGTPRPGGPQEAARRLQDLGTGHVLITGLAGERTVCEDLLFSGDVLHKLAHRKIETNRLHGTGCLHSSSVAARLGRGESVLDAATGAGQWIEQAIEQGLAFGAGGSPDGSWSGRTESVTTTHGSRA